MTMSGAGDRMTTVEVEILVAVARVDPNTLAAFSRDGHLFVRGELKLIFVRHHQNTYPQITQIICVICGWLYGFVPGSIRPVFSSNPNIKFMFCTACPAAPLTRLSMAEKITTCLPRTAKPRSQKFVVFTQLMSGEPFTRRTKNES